MNWLLNFSQLSICCHSKSREMQPWTNSTLITTFGINNSTLRGQVATGYSRIMSVFDITTSITTSLLPELRQRASDEEEEAQTFFPIVPVMKRQPGYASRRLASGRSQDPQPACCTHCVTQMSPCLHPPSHARTACRRVNAERRVDVQAGAL